MTDRARILWVDEERMQVEEPYRFLQDCGYDIELALSVSDCLSKIATTKYDLFILDVMMSHGEELQKSETLGGTETGISLARRIQEVNPEALIIGCSVRPSDRVRSHFRRFCNGFISKEDLYPLQSFEKRIKMLLKHERLPPTTFIVHGRSEQDKCDLKNYLQNTIALPEPIILHERPNLGRTLIDKFEEESKEVDLVFVLLTPDDVGATAAAPDEVKHRARQNVIFELGFFFAKVQRRSGRLILLYKGDLELPTDISGIAYIDITHGINAAGEEIRRELAGII